MTSNKETFDSVLASFGYRYDLHNVFEDFLTMSLCAVTRNPMNGKSHYEDLYLQTIAPYAKDELRFSFPTLFALLLAEMEERLEDSAGNDVLGGFYELHLSKKGKSQFFTPWPICQFMAKSSVEQTEAVEGKPLRILEPACGSGRLLVAAAKEVGPHNEFYAIDIDHTCVKMTALNLFLNGIFNAEVMCADALMASDFSISYKISSLPFGVFRIEQKENSRLWHIMQNTLSPHRKEKHQRPEITLPSQNSDYPTGSGFQLQLF